MTKASAAEAPKEDVTTGTEVAKTTGTAVVGVTEDELFDLLEDSAGCGMEEITSADMIMPFVRVLQSNSPAAMKGHADYIKDAEPGDFLDTSVTKIYKGDIGLYMVPVKFIHQYTEWKPRKLGGGKIAEHDENIMKVVVRDEKGRLSLPNGNDLVESLTWFCLLIDPFTLQATPAVIPMSGTQQRAAKSLNTKIRGIRINRVNPQTGEVREFAPPAWYSMFRATTKMRQNDDGSWYVWNLESEGSVQEYFKENPNFVRSVYAMARQMHEDIQAGLIKAAALEEEEGSPGEGSGTKDAVF